MKIAVLFAIGALVGVLGDACHIASGTTAYAPTKWPFLWLSPLWFPLVCGTGVVATALVGRTLGLPSSERSRPQAGSAVLAMTALYAFTSLLRSQVPTVSVVIVGTLAVLTWCVWDPSPRCLAVALASASIATVSEALIARAGVHHYAPDSNGLYGLAPWLPGLFFAQGAIASGLWNALWAAPTPSRMPWRLDSR